MLSVLFGMKNTHPTNRVRSAMLLAFVAALALGSFWILEIMRKTDDEEVVTRDRNEPDFYVENFRFIRVSQTGDAEYSVTGKKLTHYPADDSYVIEQPVINSLSLDQPPMLASSKHARIAEDNSKIHMYDDVYVDRPATPQRQRLQLRSDYMLLNTEQNTVQTDKPVVINLGQSILKGTGMLANHATGKFQLMNSVDAKFQAVKRNQTQ